MKDNVLLPSLSSVFFFFFVLSVTVSGVAPEDGNEEPMVAFMCNKPAMHMTDKGWIKDDATNCLKDPVDILNYCRKVYFKLDVWNIVEASQLVNVKNWCNFGHSRCHNKFSVRPYRCLIGSFESEALEVPEHCHFDHVHNADECKSYDAWNQTTTELCANRSARLRGFSILQPCGIDGFSGAEYVCCPLHAFGEVTVKHGLSKDVMMTSSKPVIVTKMAATVSRSMIPPSDAVTTETDYVRYLRDPADPSLNEHEYYLRAKDDLDKVHHEKVIKIMKEWASARHRVEQIKKSDVKGGEKFNREMTARFQKAYESLEREGVQQKKQLTSVHQQRVQSELNTKKRGAMDVYLESLRDEEPDATRVLKSLMHYIKTEQKDRIHTINHYQHVQESDPVEAESIRSDIADHLRGIDQRVTQSIDMLGQLPKYEKKIRIQIEKFLSSYQSLDESLSVIMTKINEQSNSAKKSSKTLSLMESETTAAAAAASASASASEIGGDKTAATATKPTVVGESSDLALAGSTLKGTSFEGSIPLMFTPRFISQTTEGEGEDEEDRKETPMIDVKPDEHVAYVDKSDLVVLENYIKKRPIKSENGLHVAAPLGIAIGGIAVFVAIIFGITLLRKRVTTVPARQSNNVTEVDRRSSSTGGAADAAATTQMNGYENPTYQYYAAAKP